MFTRTLVVFLIAALPAFGQSPASRQTENGQAAEIDYATNYLRKIATAVRISDEILVDGRLDEPAWGLAIPATDFSQWSPQNGPPALERTEVRFLYDADNLYVGFTCFDSDAAHILVNELRKDYSPGVSDGISLAIDSLRDHRTGFLFGTNPAGARRDAQIVDTGQINGTPNNDWDGVWDVKVSRNDTGWMAEFIIPFKTLRFSNSPTQEWGMNVTRRALSRNEQSNWAPLPPRSSVLAVAFAGTLRGIENIRQGRNLTIKPFVIAGGAQVRDGDHMQTLQSLSRFKDYDGGVDAKYGLTQSLTLDATYRTDFAQVEVDQQQTNLTRFGLFFPEKRDFFLENAGIFGFGASVPLAGGGGGGGGGGAPNPVNLAPFYSRRIGLAAGTPIPIVGGARVSGTAGPYGIGFLSMKTESLKSSSGQVLVPSNNYLVGRVRRNFMRASHVGAILTSRDAAVPDNYNRVYGADVHIQFFSKLDFESFILNSDSPGPPEESRKTQARKFGAGWRGDELIMTTEYNLVQPDFNPEMGFLRRGNMSQYSGDFSWLPRFRNNKRFRNLKFNSTVDYFGGAGSGKVETRTQSSTFGVQLQNNGYVNFTVNQSFDRLVTPFEIHAPIAIATGDYSYRDFAVQFSTDQAGVITGNGTFNWGDFYNGDRKSIVSGLVFRPNAHLSVNMTYNRDAVNLPNGSFTTQLVGARLGYAFSPRAFLNGFFQYNTDTHQVSSNIRFNIIHHPLSDLYLVYNDRRDASNHQLMERAFIVKFTNLFSF